MDARYITIEKKARYYLSGPPDKKYKSVCFALHGYGQLASYFLRNFKSENFKDILFIVPEGLHRFYLNNNSGRVGASWMTKEDRLSDIEDYINYLDTLYNAYTDVIESASTVGILGFSQGVATACRWLAQSNHKFDYLINWAGAFPPDLDFEKALDKMRYIPIWMVCGDEDEYISEIQFQDHLNLLKSKGFTLEWRIFKGKHKIDQGTLEGIFEDGGLI